MNENNPPPSPSHEVSRRRFFEQLSLVLSGVAGAGLAAPAVGFIVGPLFRRVPLIWRSVGAVDSFKVGETVAVRFEASSPERWAGVSARTAAWLRRETDTRFIAFAINCTHLGCPVRWLPQAELFMCPCHGGVYYRDGTVAAGPPPRPLVRYPVRLVGTEVQVQAGPIPIT
jgi:menaquinol-cytochrome c reductase iron-sulfur subunit